MTHVCEMGGQQPNPRLDAQEDALKWHGWLSNSPCVRPQQFRGDAAAHTTHSSDMPDPHSKTCMHHHKLLHGRSCLCRCHAISPPAAVHAAGRLATSSNPVAVACYAGGVAAHNPSPQGQPCTQVGQEQHPATAACRGAGANILTHNVSCDVHNWLHTCCCYCCCNGCSRAGETQQGLQCGNRCGSLDCARVKGRARCPRFHLS